MAEFQIIEGDALEKLSGMESGSVHTCVTSPPYFGLRDYGISGQLGLESSPEAYVSALVDVFREVRRVLRDDGTVWLNLGDSYAGGNQTGRNDNGRPEKGRGWAEYDIKRTKLNRCDGLKPKDLIGIPWMVAFALRSDGWYLRSEIIWNKPNPMPESVTDRCTKSHEQIFLFAKGQWVSRVIKFADLPSERVHFGCYIGGTKPGFTNPVTGFCISLASSIFDSAQRKSNFSLPPFYAEEWKNSFQDHDSLFISNGPDENRITAIAVRFLCAETTAKEFLQEMNRLWLSLPDGNDLLVGGGLSQSSFSPTVNRNADGTISINDSGQVCKFDFLHGKAIISRPSGCSYFYDADAIAEPSSESSGWARERAKGIDTWKYNDTTERIQQTGQRIESSTLGAFGVRNRRSVWTVNTKPYPGAHFATFPPELIKPCILAGCVEGGTVLDPFSGAGTTGLVALRHNRNFVGIELNPEYCAMARRRIWMDSPLFNIEREVA